MSLGGIEGVRRETRWRVHVTGGATTLEHWLQGQQLVMLGGNYLLNPEIFSGCSSVQEVRCVAGNTLFKLNRYAATYLPSLGRIRAQQISGWEAGMETHYVKVEAAIAIATASVEVWVGEADGSMRRIEGQSPEVLLWDRLLNVDDSVVKVERLLEEQAHDWVNLARVLEVIERDVGGKSKLIQQGFSNRTERSLFGSTANHPAAAGDLARHGVSKEEPPDKPMTLPDACAYVERIRQRWLRAKLDRLQYEASAL